MVLNSVRAEVLVSYQSYARHEGKPWSIAPITVDLDTSKGLRSNYALTYADRPLSPLRAAVMATAYAGLCALCGETQASAIDHYLPKDKYPELSILSDNLIPVCDPCNKKKSNKVGSREKGRFIHPYFDNLTSMGAVLNCVITKSANQLNVDFDVRTDLPSKFQKVAKFHFDNLDLALKYAEASTVEILNHAGLFYEAYTDEGFFGVKREAGRLEKSIRRKFDEPYWKVALYKGMQASTDFCERGYELICP